MRGVMGLGKPALVAILLAAPIGNTTVLLLFSLSLEALLTLLLFRERRRRLETGAMANGTPVALLYRTVPQLRRRRAPSMPAVIVASRWRTAPSEATSFPRGKRAVSGPVERHV